jgi:hypothetical protein
MEIAIIIWLLCAIGGGLITQSKGRSFIQGFGLGFALGIIGIIIALCLKNKKNANETQSITQNVTTAEIQGRQEKSSVSESKVNADTQKYYIYLENEVYGPFTLSSLKTDYPILKDTLITTDTLNGEWYEAQYFECFDELFNAQQGFRINEFGEIVRI